MKKIPCRHCGLLLDESDGRCATCGSTQLGPASQAPPQKARVVPRIRTPQTPSPVHIISSDNKSHWIRTRRGRLGWTRVAMGVAILAGITFALWPRPEFSSPTDRNEPPPTDNASSGSTDAEPSAEIAERDSERSVVQIRVFQDSNECWRASGVVYPTPEFVVTNSHVVDAVPECRPDYFEIWVASVRNTTLTYAHSARVVASDPASDTAILQLDDLGSNPAALTPVGLTTEPEIGDELLVLGFPDIGGESLTASRGIVSGFIEQGGSFWIKTDASNSGGSSGGAALTADRLLVGVVSQASSSSGGDVVDCRVVADTNGDGSINDRDTCVPLGSGVTLLSPAATIRELVDSALQ